MWAALRTTCWRGSSRAAAAAHARAATPHAARILAARAPSARYCDDATVKPTIGPAHTEDAVASAPRVEPQTLFIDNAIPIEAERTLLLHNVPGSVIPEDMVRVAQLLLKWSREFSLLKERERAARSAESVALEEDATSAAVFPPVSMLGNASIRRVWMVGDERRSRRRVGARVPSRLPSRVCWALEFRSVDAAQAVASMLTTYQRTIPLFGRNMRVTPASWGKLFPMAVYRGVPFGMRGRCVRVSPIPDGVDEAFLRSVFRRYHLDFQYSPFGSSIFWPTDGPRDLAYAHVVFADRAEAERAASMANNKVLEVKSTRSHVRIAAHVIY